MVKKTMGIMIGALLLFSLAACNQLEEGETFEWTNENAIYAYVKAGHETEIINDVEAAFGSLSFEKVYVVQKQIDASTPLELLFVLEENGSEKQQDFIDLLNKDSRISHARKSRDLPFDTVDNRHIDKVKDTIAVGETLILEAKGNIDYYVQPFNREGFLIKPMISKTYTVADFPHVDLKSVVERDNGWLYLELTSEGYFEVIKAIDTLSRLSTIKSAMPERELISIIPPVWNISDSTIAIFESTNYGGAPSAVIRGIKSGKVIVDFDGVSCEITVK